MKRKMKHSMVMDNNSIEVDLSQGDISLTTVDISTKKKMVVEHTATETLKKEAEVGAEAETIEEVKVEIGTTKEVKVETAAEIQAKIEREAEREGILTKILRISIYATKKMAKLLRKFSLL